MDLYPKRRKALSVKSLLLSLAAALLLYWFGGVPVWGAATFAAVQFLLMGGLRLFKLLYKTLPRDLRCIPKIHKLSFYKVCREP